MNVVSAVCALYSMNNPLSFSGGELIEGYIGIFLKNFIGFLKKGEKGLKKVLRANDGRENITGITYAVQYPSTETKKIKELKKYADEQV
jgi:hypothetical protein